MKNTLKKALAVVLSLALMATVMISCFTITSSAESVSYVTNDATAQANLATDFDVYYSSNATAGTLTKSAFADHFDFSTSGYLTHKPQNATSDFWADVSNNVTNLIYNKQQYRDFEMVIRGRGNGSDPNGDWKRIGLVFGVQDPTKWNAAGMGFNTGINFNFDNLSAAYLDSYTAKAFGVKNYTADSGSNVMPHFFGWKYEFNMKLKVVGTTATLTMDKTDWGSEYIDTVTFTLDRDYVGGYVGLTFIPDNAVVYTINITDLGGTVEDAKAPTTNMNGTYDLRNDASARAAIAEDFDIYYSNDATAGTLTKASFADHFTVGTGSVSHKPTETMGNDDFWTKYTTNITTMIYNVKQYRDFEITIDAAGSGSGGWADWCDVGLVFGVTDPTKWNVAGRGFAAGVSFNQGQQSTAYVNSFTKYADAATNYTANVATMPNFQGWNYNFRTVLRVENGTATVTMEKAEWGITGDVQTFDLGDDYYGGYIGLRFISDASSIYSITIKDLGGTVEAEPVPDVNGKYNFANSVACDAVAKDFDVYYSNNATAGTLSKVDFADHFSVASGYINHTAQQTLTNDNFWDLYSSDVTTMIYNKKNLQNFEIEIQAQGTGDPYGDWRNIQFLFGVSDPTAWGKTGMGFNAGIMFNSGNTSVPFMTYYKADNTKVDLTANSHAMDSYCGAKYGYTYKLRVEGRKATLTATVESWENHTLTSEFTLPSDYAKGSVGIKFMSDDTYIWKINVTDLGDTVEEIKGDSNGDGVVDQIDYDYVTKYLLSIDGYEYSEAIDMNDDGQVDVVDAIMIRKIIA